MVFYDGRHIRNILGLNKHNMRLDHIGIVVEDIEKSDLGNADNNYDIEF